MSFWDFAFVAYLFVAALFLAATLAEGEENKIRWGWWRCLGIVLSALWPLAIFGALLAPVWIVVTRKK